MKTLKTIWLIYSALGMTLIIVTLFVPHATILDYTPTCYSIRQFGKQCFMCGSTRSFIQMGNGNLNQALQFNKIAAALFLIVSINTIIFAYYILTNLKTRNLRNT